ncbi:MAG TPA: IgGFc-binding protein [Polyangiaceae bacterium]
MPTRAYNPLLLFALVALGCGYDRTDRWLYHPSPAPPLCALGSERCHGALESCVQSASGPVWQTLDDCAARGLICAPSLLACRTCEPNGASCEGQTVMQCDATGNNATPGETCDTSAYEACRNGVCGSLCAAAARNRSNVGCEYFAVDLDNADVSDSQNAAAQQFAVVVSNPNDDVSTEITIEQDDSLPGSANAPYTIASATIPPLGLRIFRLGPREVDGSPDGQYNTGTNTALTRHAFRLRSTFPTVAYQFNPLENVNVFSNDASLLKPTEAVTPDGSSLVPSYAVLGWPQTIAATSDPDTNFSPQSPVSLRAFLTVVGTQAGTHIHLNSTTRILGGGAVPATPKNGTLDFDLGAFDVLNLETDDFNADFTGSVLAADAPIVVFSGSEASDAPFFNKLSERQCCADHLEQQLDHLRTAGKKFVATVSPNRTRAVHAAGGVIGEAPQPEYFRVIAATTAGAHVTTTLSGQFQQFDLTTLGSFQDLTSDAHFMLQSDQPVMLSSVSPSQEAANVPTGLPGGDPSLLVIPPIEQFRSSYVFLNPDKYIFDFLRIIAPAGATVMLDGVNVDDVDGCVPSAGDGLARPDLRTPPGPAPFTVFTCQLSFPVIDPTQAAPLNVSPGLQNDGVHRVESDQKIGVLVDGFDSFVSYAYAAGTELTFIVPK